MTTPLRSTDNGNEGGFSQTPVQAEPALAQRKAKSWHTVIGTLSIIMGVLGFCCWGLGSIGTVSAAFGNPVGYNESMQGNATDGAYADVKIMDGQNDNENATSEFRLGSSEVIGQIEPFDIVLNFISFLLTIMLLVGGIGMVNKKSWARSTLLLWAWLKILITILWLIWQFTSINDQIPLIAEEMRKSMEQQGNADQFELVMGWIKPVITIGIILLGLFFLIWPLFLVFFLGRDKIRDEAAGWGGFATQGNDGWSAE